MLPPLYCPPPGHIPVCSGLGLLLAMSSLLNIPYGMPDYTDYVFLLLQTRSWQTRAPRQTLYAVGKLVFTFLKDGQKPQQKQEQERICSRDHMWPAKLKNIYYRAICRRSLSVFVRDSYPEHF